MLHGCIGIEHRHRCWLRRYGTLKHEHYSTRDVNELRSQFKRRPVSAYVILSYVTIFDGAKNRDPFRVAPFELPEAECTSADRDSSIRFSQFSSNVYYVQVDDSCNYSAERVPIIATSMLCGVNRVRFVFFVRLLVTECQ